MRSKTAIRRLLLRLCLSMETSRLNEFPILKLEAPLGQSTFQQVVKKRGWSGAKRCRGCCFL